MNESYARKESVCPYLLSRFHFPHIQIPEVLKRYQGIPVIIT